MPIDKIETRFDEGQQSLYRLLQQHLDRSQALGHNQKPSLQENGFTVSKQDWKAQETYKVRLEGMNRDGLFLVKSMKNKGKYEDLKAALRKLDYEDLKPVGRSGIQREVEMQDGAKNKVFLCRTRQTYIRGKILNVYPTLGFCVIADIDECKSYPVRLEFVFELLPEYCELPARVSECVLHGVNSRTLAFRPAINNTLSLIHGNVLMTVVTEENSRPALVGMTLPSGCDLSSLILYNIHQNVSQLPLCVNMDAVFSDCGRTVELQRFLKSALRKDILDDSETLKYLERHTHVEVELFFRSAAKAGGSVYPLDDLYGAIIKKSGRPLPLRELGYRSYYSFLYAYSHLFQVKTFTGDHLGRIFIHIEDINGKDIDDGFTGVESFVQLKPEVLLMLDMRVNVDRQQKSSSFVQEGQQPTKKDAKPQNQQNSPKCWSSKGQNGKSFNHILHRKDTEYAEKIAKMIPFSQECPPVRSLDPLALYFIPDTGYYIFYPADESVMFDIPNYEPKLHEVSGMDEIVEATSEETNRLITGLQELELENVNLPCMNPYLHAGLELDAILVGMDSNGFVHFSLDNEEVGKLYSEMLEDLQAFYSTNEMRRALKMTRSFMQVGTNAVGKITDQYRRVRIYQHYTSKQSCWVVDLESREFHLVSESDLFNLTSDFAQLPPKADPGILTGIENYLMTPILPTLLSRIELHESQVRVKIIEPFHEHLQIPVVQITVQGKDLSEMLLDACLQEDSVLGDTNPEWDSVKTFLKLYLLGRDE